MIFNPDTRCQGYSLYYAYSFKYCKERKSMLKPKLQTEEKYSGDIQLEKILILILSSNITKIDQMPLIFTLQQEGINYGLQ